MRITSQRFHLVCLFMISGVPAAQVLRLSNMMSVRDGSDGAEMKEEDESETIPVNHMRVKQSSWSAKQHFPL